MKIEIEMTHDSACCIKGKNQIILLDETLTWKFVMVYFAMVMRINIKSQLNPVKFDVIFINATKFCSIDLVSI